MDGNFWDLGADYKQEIPLEDSWDRLELYRLFLKESPGQSDSVIY